MKGTLHQSVWAHVVLILFLIATISVAVVAMPKSRPRQESAVLLNDIPHIVKRPDFGGEACLAMALQAKGYKTTQDDIFNLSGVEPEKGCGCNATELKKTAEFIGFETGPTWYPASKENKNQIAAQTFAYAVASLQKKIPVVFLMRQSTGDAVVEQFALMVGYDPVKKTVSVHDPNGASGKFRQLSERTFKNAILAQSSEDQYYVFCLPLKEKRIRPFKPTPKGFTDADYAQHIRKLREKLPDDSFKIVIQKPFVVVGDESQTMLERRAVGTVKWAVDKIKKQYFKKDPKYILDIWLFKDKQSYEKNTVKLWGSKPHTPFGYYSASKRALVMNISTGGGTLVHEIVHPFMESNFADCPSWFNEGLASLYEQSRENGGKIWGSTNWRLRGLQAAIQSDRVPSFKELCSTTRREFYEEDRGTNYSQARYLCYYLQEKGLLNKYYHLFVKNAKKDPTGYQTLKSVLKTDDMDQFKKDWQKYVMDLRFGR